MTNQQKIDTLKKCFEDTIWMSIRYAHGRHTYAPGMVRDAVKNFKKVFPDWKPREDKALENPWESESGDIFQAITIPSDYLNDLFV